jgi:NAD(P)-dependent dehydrogenase (short-subunit alcohol dehydrogenase family)
VAIVVAVAVLCVYVSGFVFRMQWQTCADVLRASQAARSDHFLGRTVVVTGGSSGIGLHLTLALARIGARVIVGCRDVVGARATLARESVRVVHLDLTSPASVEAFAAEAAAGENLRLAVFNAGMFPSDTMQVVDATGVEMCFVTNHVGHFQLARALRKSLAPDGRLVFVSSGSQDGPLSLEDATSSDQWRAVALPRPGEYSALRAYGSSKLANSLCARYFHMTGTESCAVWPGALITTGISRHRSPLEQFVFRYVISHFTMSADQGAAPVLWACLEPGLSGRCVDHTRVVFPDTQNNVSDTAAEALAAVTSEILARSN